MDWPSYPPPSPPTWITTNDSTKAYHEGSVANVPFRNRVRRGIGLSDSTKADVSIPLHTPKSLISSSSLPKNIGYRSIKVLNQMVEALPASKLLYKNSRV